MEAIAEIAIRADEPAIDLLDWKALHNTRESTPVLAAHLGSVNRVGKWQADLVASAPKSVFPAGHRDDMKTHLKMGL